MKLNRFRSFFSFLVVLTVIITLFSGCSNGSKNTAYSGNTIKEKINADFITQPDITGLVDNSKIIVSGKVLKVDSSVKVPINFDYPDRVTKEERSKLENSEDGYYMCTVYEVEVSKVIKGDIKESEVIEIYQLGGSSKEKESIVDGIDYFKQGDNRIFFITDWDGRYTTVNPIQGDIKLVDKKAKVNKGNKLFHDGIAEDELFKNIKSEVEKGKSANN